MSDPKQHLLWGTSSADAPGLSPHQDSAQVLLTHTTRWRERVAAAFPERGEQERWLVLLAALEHLAARHRGVPTWHEHADAEQVAGWLEADLTCAQLEDAHLLGWLLQAYHHEARGLSFASHTAQETKHLNATVATQVYTPRWLADFMAITLLEPRGSERELARVADPCVGGGQMLLAALDELRRTRPEASAVELASALWGVDLDERAVMVARAALFARCMEHDPSGEPARVRAILAAQIMQGDGLTAALEPVDVVMTNPPYMGLRAMPPELKKELVTHWKPFHHDLYLAFMKRALELCPGGRAGLLTQQTVWFLSRFAPAREQLMGGAALTHFVHVGAGVFDALSGEKASVVVTLHDQREERPASTGCLFVDLRPHRTPKDARREALEHVLRDPLHAQSLMQDLDTFAHIPARPLAHELAPELRALFGEHALRVQDLAEVPGAQNKTGKNSLYVSAWGDVSGEELGRASSLAGHTPPEQARWVFYSKGGRFAPWWGNWDYVVDWSEQARAFYSQNKTSNLLHASYWFREGICYTDFGGRSFNARWMPAGCLFDMTGPAIFAHGDTPAEQRQRALALLAVLNTSPARAMLNALNPSLHYQVRDVRNLPVPPAWDEAMERELAGYSKHLIACTRALHLLLPGDPLYDEESARSPESAVRARAVRAEIERCWRELEQVVCAHYGVPHLSEQLPRDVHHIVGRVCGEG